MVKGIKERVYQALSGITEATVSYYYPEDFNLVLPAITYYELDNSALSYADDRECLSDVDIQIDIYSRDSTTALACEVDKAMAGLDFIRAYSGDLYDAENKLQHKTMRYTGAFDND